jgi:hypothetical protein
LLVHGVFAGFPPFQVAACLVVQVSSHREKGVKSPAGSKG